MGNRDKDREVLLKEIERLKKRVRELERTQGLADDLSESLKRLEDKINIILDAARKINSVLDLTSIMRNLVSSAIMVVEAESGASGFFCEGKMVFTEYNDKGRLIPVEYVFEKGQGVPGHIIETKRPYISNDTKTDPIVIQEIRERLDFYNLIDVPILDKEGRLLGCFEIHNKKDRLPFDERDLVLLKGLADVAAVAMEHARIIQGRKKAEEALRESEKLFRTLVEASSECVCNLDLEGRFIYMSPAGLKACSTDGEEVVGRYCTEFMKEPYRDVFMERLGEAKTGKTVSLQYETIIPSGRWFESILTPIKDDSGRVGSVLRLSRDITERKELESQFLRSQKMEAIGRLAGGIAHDFNNLLTTIIGNTDLLMLTHTPENHSYERLRAIREAGEHAAQLTRQLLVMSKRQVMEPVPLNLNAVISGMGKMLERLIGEDIRLDFQLGDDLKEVRADPSQIEQVILNLVVNAREAMPGGGKLSISTENVYIDEGYSRSHPDVKPGEYVLLGVSDTGTGLTKDVYEHIFEPFFTTKKDGTGLGLSTVYGIVKQSGGEIFVYSEEDIGTTFKIYLPALEGGIEGPRERTTVTAAEMEGGDETIIVVEDDKEILELTTTILTGLGYSVLAASSYNVLKEKLKGFKSDVDLLLTDVVLSGKRGHEIATELRRAYKDLKVIFMSGYPEDLNSFADVIEGRVHFLSKPFTPSQLASKIREVLNGL